MTQEINIDELLGGGPSPDVRLERAPVVVSAVAPTGAASMSLEHGAYEGARRFDNALATWNPGLGSADSDILPDKMILDARTRDSVRNDAYVNGGAVLHQDNIVGSMFLLNCKPETKVLFGAEDDAWEQEFQEEVETKFTLAAESPNCYLDASRIGTFTDNIRLAVGVFVASGGEVLATAEWMPNDGRPFRTAVQMVDTDRLSDPADRIYDQQFVRRGVERDIYGAPQAYYIQMGHPTDYANPDAYKWKRVPIRKPWGRQQVLHIYDRRRADQTRGISAMVSALKEMRMTKKFRDIVLQNAVLNATYAASIESDMPSDAVFAALGGENDAPFESYAAGYLEAVSAYSGGAKNMTLDGVKIPHLMPGTKLKLNPAGNGGPLGQDFEKSLLRYLAANLGVSYEQLSRDYTSTNYSSARAAMSETWKFMQSRKKQVADRYANFHYRLWLEEMINKGQLETLKRANVPNWYEGMNADAYSSCDWIGAGRGQIDELKETEAAVLRINNRLSTREYEIARLHGGDWRRIARQIARERKWDEKFSLEPVQVVAGNGAAKPAAQQDTTGAASA